MFLKHFFLVLMCILLSHTLYAPYFFNLHKYLEKDMYLKNICKKTTENSCVYSNNIEHFLIKKKENMNNEKKRFSFSLIILIKRVLLCST